MIAIEEHRFFKVAELSLWACFLPIVIVDNNTKVVTDHL
jgi:hypothetical protein